MGGTQGGEAGHTCVGSVAGPLYSMQSRRRRATFTGGCTGGFHRYGCGRSKQQPPDAHQAPEDQTVPRQQFERQAANIPDAELVWMEGGHIADHSGPEDLAIGWLAG